MPSLTETNIAQTAASGLSGVVVVGQGRAHQRRRGGRAAAVVTIGTWNLENLFRPGQGDGPGSEEVYQTKLDALAETISVVEPDEPDFISSASPVGSTWLKPDTVTQRCTRLCTRLG